MIRRGSSVSPLPSRTGLRVEDRRFRLLSIDSFGPAQETSHRTVDCPPHPSSSDFTRHKRLAVLGRQAAVSDGATWSPCRNYAPATFRHRDNWPRLRELGTFRELGNAVPPLLRVARGLLFHLCHLYEYY